MTQLLYFATLLVTTLFAAAAAVALNGMLLRLMFALMRPASATARQRVAPTRLATGTVQLARAYAAHR
jgi:hypothetical protein